MAKKKASPKRPVKKAAPKGKSATAKKAPAPKGSKVAEMQASQEELLAAWGQSRGQVRTYEVPDIVDGDYIAQLTRCTYSRTGGRNKAPQLRFYYVVKLGDYEGTQLSDTEDLSNEIAFNDIPRIALLIERLERSGIDTEQIENPFEELPEIAKQLSDPESEIGQPLVRIKVSVTELPAEKSSTGEARRFINVRARGTLTEEEFEEIANA